MNVQITENFHSDEFKCKCGCGLSDIDTSLIFALQKVRDEVATPMLCASGLRCKTWNKAVGGAENSSHQWGKAVDIACDDGVLRHRLMESFMKHFKRIGVAKTFIHVDNDHMKTHPVIWTY